MRSAPHRMVVLVLAAIGAGACSTDDDDNFTTAVADGDNQRPPLLAPLRVKLEPPALLIKPGASATVKVTVESDAALPPSLTLAASRLPSGITVAPLTIAGSTAALTFAASSAAPAGATTLVAVEALSPTRHGAADLELTTTAPAPALDATFGDGGKTKIGAGVAREELDAVALQADGKLVVAGAYRTGYTTVPAVARYLATGALDTTFGQGGVVLLEKHDGFAVGVAVQADGKIVVLEPNDFTLTRLDGAGAIDLTFNGTGVTSAGFPGEARGTALAVQPDGKIVVVGGAVAGEPDFALARFLPDGTVDPGFGTAGRAVTAVVAGEDVATSIALETSGTTTTSIVVGGSAVVGAGRSAVVARYLGASGALDPSFDTDGIALFSSGAAAQDLVTGVAVVSGAVIASGHRHVDAQTDVLQVLRFTSTGALDAAFDTDGVVTVGFAAAARSHAVVVRDGKIVVAAEVGAAASQASLARLDAVTGALDTTFGTGGKVTVTIAEGSAAHALLVQPSDGALVIVGSARTGANTDALVARFTPAGVADASFDVDGSLTASFGPGDEELRAVAIQPDGKIVAAGAAFNGRDFDFLVARRLPNGLQDPSFGAGRGHVLFDHAMRSEFAYDVRLQGDGKIVVGGQGGPGTLVVRLLADGTLDASFGTAGVAAIAGGDGYGMALQADGKVIVGGPSMDGDFFVARLTSAGAPDTGGVAGVGFGQTGVLTTDFGLGLPERAITVVVDGAGKVVVVGHVDHGKPPNFFDLAIARYDANGVLDETLDSDGKVTLDTANVELLYAAAVQPDGKILLGGRMQLPGRATSFGLYRLTARGGVDTTFGTKGRAAIDLQDGSQASAIVVEPQGIILAAGRSSADRLLLARLSPSGAPIWPDGAVTTPFGGRAEAFALARQTDARVVLAGIGRGALDDQAVLVRYEP